MASPCIGIYACLEEPSNLSIFEAGLSDAMDRHKAYKNLSEGFEGTLSTIHRLHHASQKTQASAHSYRLGRKDEIQEVWSACGTCKKCNHLEKDCYFKNMKESKGDQEEKKKVKKLLDRGQWNKTMDFGL
ncbi:hypothetical protein WN48_00206 [Eufriesea mexicana]|uniref:Uncharacterized protein n=1 Tax=Eufriesea mexicana TaxID=516756 RepID=A0A310SQA0_9HYME|nr:hypothetical protein WN48_00206 [Eufriesea mexicana]